MVEYVDKMVSLALIQSDICVKVSNNVTDIHR